MDTQFKSESNAKAGLLEEYSLRRWIMAFGGHIQFSNL